VKTVAQGPLASSIESYLAHKRALGKQLEKTGPMLHLLDGYLVERGVTELVQITPANLEAFVRSRPRQSPRSYNELLGMLRRLFDWLVRQEKLATSPLQCSPRRVTPGRKPFLFSPDEARRLLHAARQLSSTPRSPFRGETYRMIFAILYGLGLRVGEVSRLRRKDVDLANRLLVIRKTKFGKDRLVPFGPQMAREITEYLQREEVCSGVSTPDCAVFSFAKDRQRLIRTTTMSWIFHKLIAELILVIPAGVAPPHLHCLRHSFAVGTLLRWYRTGIDPMSRLLDLSTFLGHVSPSSTAVYLTITTELLECANQRFAHFAAGTRGECVR